MEDTKEEVLAVLDIILYFVCFPHKAVQCMASESSKSEIWDTLMVFCILFEV